MKKKPKQHAKHEALAVGAIVMCSCDCGGCTCDEMLAGIVTAVNDDHTVNLAVFATDGSLHPCQNVPVCGEDDQPDCKQYCCAK